MGDDKLRVLAVGAHPDDCEILCSGTLARFAALGHPVTICVATDGSAGHMLIPPPELARIREAEARKSASLIGAEFIWLGYTDECLANDHATRLRFVNAIREARPDLILTHAPEDYHPDHRQVQRLVFDASFLSTVKAVETEFPFYPKIAPLYYFDTLASMNFVPTEYVDISPTFEIKRAMMGCHQSQITWLMDHDKIDILDFITTMAKLRGLQCGVPFAEGFRAEAVWPRGTTQRLLP